MSDIALVAGLGSNLDDICGKDWDFGGGDHGDAGNNKLFAIGIYFKFSGC